MPILPELPTTPAPTPDARTIGDKQAAFDRDTQLASTQRVDITLEELAAVVTSAFLTGAEYGARAGLGHEPNEEERIDARYHARDALERAAGGLRDGTLTMPQALDNVTRSFTAHNAEAMHWRAYLRVLMDGRLK